MTDKKSTNSELLSTEMLRARIAKMEYSIPKNPTEEDIANFQEKIRQIYIEETGNPPPVNIDIYHSGTKKYQSITDSGFDGTVIHFYDPEKGINQSYTLTRGSEMGEDAGEGKPLDWLYNVFGIYTGKNKEQFDDAKKFAEEVNSEITAKTSKEGLTKLDNYGIGHSLGGNLIQMLQLNSGSFKEVYTFNDAPPSAYQLAYIDTKFRRNLVQHFGISALEFDEIYSIPSAQLEKFATDYYKERGKNIHHTTSADEILFAISSFRGFLFFGDRKIIETNPDFDGLKNVLDNVSDEDLAVIQKKLAEIAPYYEKDGIDGIVLGVTGFNKKFWDQSIETLKDLDLTTLNPVERAENAITVAKTLVAMKDHVGLMIDKVTSLKDELPALLSIVGTVSAEEREKIESVIDGMVDNLETMKAAIENIGDVATLEKLRNGDLKGFLKQIEVLMNTSDIIKTEFNEFKAGFGSIKTILEELMEKFGMATEAHLMDAVISALSLDGFSYEGDDMFKAKMVAGKPILINLSSALRLYKEGLNIYEEKNTLLKQIKEAYHREYTDDYALRKGTLMKAIASTESDTAWAQSRLGYSTTVYKVTKIDVQETIYPIPPANTATFQELFHYHETEQEAGVKQINQIKNSVEKFFQEDQKVASMFKLI
ncbi:DUF6792 domain-containing protein [Bacillus sp. SJS]|uniref:DUF6792 domain-containing protein n=1 Tax=Bacillus sp. SJS TaxID=1423321 RepID=UPI00068CEA56|nr:DUF6792 domain-containing protein [Bacillus sp. SJS]KZZ84987.1 hypothetical protein AS29_008010 [Bacillus sp. SJS]